MGKHVTLMAIIGGDECVVGKCHPGQARILIKNGMAEWRDGKVFFLQSLPSVAKKPEGWVPEGWVPAGESFKRKIERSPDWAKRVEINNILSGLEIPTSSVVEASPAEIKCDSFLEWHQIAEERKAAGHTLLSCDDPYQRMIGFVDDTTNEWFGVGLMKFKEGPPELKEALASRDGRISFFSSGGLDEFIQGFFSEEPSEGESENQPENLDLDELTLESIWMADAEAEIEAHEAEALHFVLLSDGTLAESITAAETEVAPDFYRARDVANPEIPKTPRQKFEDGKLYSDDAYRSMLDEALEREALVHLRTDDGNWLCGRSANFGEGVVDLLLVTCRRCKNKAIDLIEKAEREK